MLSEGGNSQRCLSGRLIGPEGADVDDFHVEHAGGQTESVTENLDVSRPHLWWQSANDLSGVTHQAQANGWRGRIVDVGDEPVEQGGCKRLSAGEGGGQSLLPTRGQQIGRVDTGGELDVSRIGPK
jgi:hypothetical protein